MFQNSELTWLGERISSSKQTSKETLPWPSLVEDHDVAISTFHSYKLWAWNSSREQGLSPKSGYLVWLCHKMAVSCMKGKKTLSEHQYGREKSREANVDAF